MNSENLFTKYINAFIKGDINLEEMQNGICDYFSDVNVIMSDEHRAYVEYTQVHKKDRYKEYINRVSK